MWGGVVVGWQKDGRLAGESAKELLSSLIYLTKDCAQSALVESPETLTERERISESNNNNTNPVPPNERVSE